MLGRDVLMGGEVVCWQVAGMQTHFSYFSLARGLLCKFRKEALQRFFIRTVSVLDVSPGMPGAGFLRMMTNFKKRGGRWAIFFAVRIWHLRLETAGALLTDCHTESSCGRVVAKVVYHSWHSTRGAWWLRELMSESVFFLFLLLLLDPACCPHVLL